MTKKGLDDSIASSVPRGVYGRVSWPMARPARSLYQTVSSSRLHHIHFESVYFSPEGYLNQRLPCEQQSTRERRENQRCKSFIKPSVLRAVQVTHKGALPTTNPAHSQHQLFLESHYDDQTTTSEHFLPDDPRTLCVPGHGCPSRADLYRRFHRRNDY